MAVIEEFTTSQGVHIRIRDDAIAEVSKEEMDRRVRRSQVVAWHIAEAAARRERGAAPSSALRAPSPQGEG